MIIIEKGQFANSIRFSYLHDWQLMPEYPGRHVHVYPPLFEAQIPLFKHGLEAHESIAKCVLKNKFNVFYSLILNNCLE